MKIHYENLDYQTDAISSVVDLFDTGENLANKSDFHLFDTFGVVANQLDIDKDRLKSNLSNIQKHNLEKRDVKIDEQNLFDFSVE
ncbi:hypothetical protein BHECKSOX_425, partial [Bathymodiolus heckerae thiotrophic gill symbiont]|uniref:hypothetical protein n=1 Tax=Bathymodiolus heckerae thiotrophic gill symbiont TaxID=1052212 RepID=UPI0010B1701A